jgi:hypothetical protein
MRRFLRLAVISVLLTLGCGGDVGPNSVVSTYVLRQVAGDELPTVLYSNEYGSVHVLSDTIRLETDGTGTISGVRAVEPLQPGLLPEAPTWGTAEIRFRTANHRIEMAYVCPPNANCAPPPHLIAHRRENGLHVTWAGLSGRSPMVYQAVE